MSSSSKFSTGTSDYDVMSCDGCIYYGTFLTCWATAPGYVTFISDLHYGIPLDLFVSYILRSCAFTVNSLFVAVPCLILGFRCSQI